VPKSSATVALRGSDLGLVLDIGTIDYDTFRGGTDWQEVPVENSEHYDLTQGWGRWGPASDHRFDHLVRAIRATGHCNLNLT
jgi:hypothetical protein